MKDRFYDDDRQPELPLFAQNDDADDAKVENVIGMIDRALGGGDGEDPPGDGEDPPGSDGFVPNGGKCPTCGQLAKRYKRPLYSSMALALIYLCKLYEQTEDWVHVNAISQKILRHNIGLGGDFAKLQHWGLIYQQLNKDQKKRTSGFWKPTTEGMDFALHGGKVMSHVKFYNGRSSGFAGRKIGVTDALGKKFDYAELMRS